jgi:hypothetical protein
MTERTQEKKVSVRIQTECVWKCVRPGPPRAPPPFPFRQSAHSSIIHGSSHNTHSLTLSLWNPSTCMGRVSFKSLIQYSTVRVGSSFCSI